MTITQGESQMLEEFKTQDGVSLAEHAKQGTVMLVFLRHFGCIFCKQTVARIVSLLPELKTLGVTPIFIHQESEGAEAFFSQFSAEYMLRVADPSYRLYQHFGIPKVRFVDVVSPSAMLAGLSAYRAGFRQTNATADPSQMPGLVILQPGKAEYRHQFKHAGDQPDYLGLIKQVRAS
ncbi:MAG: redoxin domain-containing protein [Armatimonadetes bacterium]|nr:redoxin domain-containing protein [Armatimonadota bacterium]